MPDPNEHPVYALAPFAVLLIAAGLIVILGGALLGILSPALRQAIGCGSLGVLAGLVCVVLYVMSFFKIE